MSEHEQAAIEVPGLGALRPLPGGYSGRAFLAETGGERSVVRLFAPDDPQAPLVAGAVLRRAAGLVAGVPEVLEVRAGDAACDVPGLLVTSWLPGEHGADVWPTLDDVEAADLARRLARLLARLASAPLPSAGRFVDADLRVEPWPEPWDDLGYAVRALAPGLHDWDREERTGLDALVEQAEDALDEPLAVPTGSVLVHADLNPKNLLLARTPEGVRVTGVLDWEFAHAGQPESDLGNLLRHEARPAFVEPLLDLYADLRGEPVGLLRDRARALDLLPLVELAARAQRHAPAERADAVLRACARARDLHAAPAPVH
ncbi:phosphotransferase family protein [Nocardioides bruguierae]|uniref:Aminoglycoside phosphotransferase family protein n=1 Tax=Nocardioides bruguierae TaxID=2945102 RepID=A0A9X2DA44_9ACTN|nr:phosphotransferase [Nocardioides bruguierae]MCM0622140.1 aminoglycoside phosphotransferase family protein [Nocardioides bruguierae]